MIKYSHLQVEYDYDFLFLFDGHLGCSDFKALANMTGLLQSQAQERLILFPFIIFWDNQSLFTFQTEFKTRSNKLGIIFLSDLSITWSGFSLTVTAEKQGERKPQIKEYIFKNQ